MPFPWSSEWFDTSRNPLVTREKKKCRAATICKGENRLRFANLHTHSYFSDGLLSPARLVEEIVDCSGLEVFALTDHDTLSGIEPVFRSMSPLNKSAAGHGLLFIPGVELSLMEEAGGLTVHLVGLFPQMTQANHREMLGRIERVLGPYCRERCLARGLRDLDARVEMAFEANLEGIRNLYPSLDPVILKLRKNAEDRNRHLFLESDKGGDVIQHPIPITYQTLLDNWLEILPSSDVEMARLFVLRRTPGRNRRLMELYKGRGMSRKEAAALSGRNAGVLARWSEPPKYKDVMEGLDLLKQTRAVTILAHPAVDHVSINRKTFDHLVTLPLIRAGLDGIEVLYPYDKSIRKDATRHYGALADHHGLFVSGGTDFHGDGRYGLAEVRLPISCASEITQASSLV